MTTKTTTPSQELAKLEAKRDEAYRKAQKAKRDRNAWADELEAERIVYGELSRERSEDHRDEAGNPREGTPLAKAQAKLRAKIDAGNPHGPAFEEAQRIFLELDAELQAYRRKHLPDLLEESRDEFEHTEERLLSALQEILGAADAYTAIENRAIGLVRDTPGITGQDLAADSRISEYRTFATNALRRLEDRPLIVPSLTELGHWNLTDR